MDKVLLYFFNKNLLIISLINRGVFGLFFLLVLHRFFFDFNPFSFIFKVDYLIY